MLEECEGLGKVRGGGEGKVIWGSNTPMDQYLIMSFWQMLEAPGGGSHAERERQMTQRGGAQLYLIRSEIARRYVWHSID